MKIEINDIHFSEEELFRGRFHSVEEKQEHFNRYGEDSCKAMRLYSENRKTSVIIPVFCVDASGKPIPIRSERKIKSCPISPEYLMELVCKVINSAEYFKHKVLYVYVCYRYDKPNHVGICASEKPLSKLQMNKKDKPIFSV